MKKGALAGIGILVLALSVVAAFAGSAESQPAPSPPTRLPPEVSSGEPTPEARPGPSASASSRRSTLFSLPSPSVNHNVSNESGNQAETYTAVEPDNPARVIAGSNPGFGNPAAWVSNDSMKPGTTVRNALPTATRLPTSEGGTITSPALCCDPTFAADDRGNFWYAVLTLDPIGPGDCTNPVFCHIVINRMAGPTGTSFQAQNTAIPRATADVQDKPMITIDSWPGEPKQYRLYATWVENPGQNVVISQCDASTPTDCDNPDNWSAPVDITAASSTYTYPSVATAPNHDVYVTWWDAVNDDIGIDRCQAADDCAVTGSWNEDAVIDSDLDPGSASALPFFCPIIAAPGGRVGALTYVDVGPDGRVYVAWGELRNNGSTNCSASGSDRTFDSYVAAGAPNTIPATNSGVRVSDDGALALNDHFFASLAADPSAPQTVEVSLYSTKLDPSGQTTQQFYVRSTDGGAGWGAMQQISTAASNFSGGNSNGFDYGDYEGADAAGGVFYPAWTDNRASQGGDSELFMLTPPGLTAPGLTPPGGTTDTTSPNTRLRGGPKGKTTRRRAKFRFSASEPGSSFRCKLDKKRFKRCRSPKTYRKLGLGKHRFKVKATDSAGNTDPTPAKRVWRVIASGG